jgi:DNA-directed RNA polymerase subunit RPC12/RpoP
MALRSMSAGSGRGTYDRRSVNCQKCAAPIPIRAGRVGKEFAVQCPKCGLRGFYSPQEIHIQQMPERRVKKPAKRAPERRSQER